MAPARVQGSDARAEPLCFGMMRRFPHVWLAALALCGLLPACDKLGLDRKPQQSSQLPSAEELKRIAYMSQGPAGPDGRKLFDHLEQAKSCADLELAMRWNRPPDIEAGPFGKKMIYLKSDVPTDLPKQAEVFLSGVIKRGAPLSSGSSGWSVRLRDGSEIQAIEAAEYRQKQEQTQQEGGGAAFVQPYVPGRALCGYGIYQGPIGKALGADKNVPLVSILFALDRKK